MRLSATLQRTSNSWSDCADAQADLELSCVPNLKPLFHYASHTHTRSKGTQEVIVMKENFDWHPNKSLNKHCWKLHQDLTATHDTRCNTEKIIIKWFKTKMDFTLQKWLSWGWFVLLEIYADKTLLDKYSNIFFFFMTWSDSMLWSSLQLQCYISWGTNQTLNEINIAYMYWQKMQTMNLFTKWWQIWRL